MPVLHSRRGGIIFRFLLFLALLFVLATFAGVKLIHSVHLRTMTRNSGDDVSLETPAGSFRVRAHEKMDPAAFGIPVYPGARRTDSSGGAEFEWISADGRDDKDVSVAGAEFITPDAASKVIDFYRGQLSNVIVIKERGRSVRLEYTDQGAKRIIGIHEKNDGTHIGVAAIGGAASN